MLRNFNSRTLRISRILTSAVLQLPNAIIELQKSVQSIITGKLKHPTWFSHGVLRSSSVSTFRLLLTSGIVRNIISDGRCSGFLERIPAPLQNFETCSYSCCSSTENLFQERSNCSCFSALQEYCSKVSYLTMRPHVPL